MASHNEIYTYVAAAIVKAATEKKAKLVEHGAGPYNEALKKLTRDEMHEYVLDAKNDNGMILFRYGPWEGSKNVRFGEFHELPSPFAYNVFLYLRPGVSVRTASVRYVELDQFL